MFLNKLVCFIIATSLYLAPNSAYSKAQTLPEPKKELSDTLPPPKPIVISAKERRNICRKYQNKYIAYYGNVFKVKGCERHTLSANETYLLTKKSISPLEIQGKVIAALPKHKPKPQKIDKKTLCRKYNRKYVSYAVEVYWVHNCKKHQFPDWSSYESHRGKLKQKQNALKLIKWEEFAAIEIGAPMPSVIDKEFRNQDVPIEILPISEACSPVAGRHVTYLDQIYFIESRLSKSKNYYCVKRAVDAEAYTKKHGHGKFRLKELTSSQALSIPLGKPLKLR